MAVIAKAARRRIRGIARRQWLTVLVGAAVVAAMVTATTPVPAAAAKPAMTVGDIHIHGATDPNATAAAVRRELERHQRAQSALLTD